MIDFHTHILPQMDDGAKDETQSLRMIDMLMSQGVRRIVCTPHFYPYRESIRDFLLRRDQAFDRIATQCRDREGLELLRGAEVYCGETLEFTSELNALRIGESPFILIELPAIGTLGPRVFKILERIVDHHGLIPVIAHAERYPAIRFTPLRSVRKLRKLGCRIQVNAGSFQERGNIGLLERLIDHDLVDFVGSDCHDTDRRPPCMRQAYDTLCATYDEETADRLTGGLWEKAGRQGRGSIFLS